MTITYTGDCCPACGSGEVIPYAVILGASEEYGYQCLVCQVTWPVLAHDDPTDLRHHAVRESTDGKQEDKERERRHAGVQPRGRSLSPSSPARSSSYAAESR
jgi:hypothetical protein